MTQILSSYPNRFENNLHALICKIFSCKSPHKRCCEIQNPHHRQHWTVLNLRRPLKFPCLSDWNIPVFLTCIIVYFPLVCHVFDSLVPNIASYFFRPKRARVLILLTQAQQLCISCHALSVWLWQHAWRGTSPNGHLVGTSDLLRWHTL